MNEKIFKKEKSIEILLKNHWWNNDKYECKKPHICKKKLYLES